MRADRRQLLTHAAAAFGLSACSTAQLTPQFPPVGFDGPRFDGGDFVSFDAARLPLECWRPAKDDPDWVIVALHGINDYAGAFADDGPDFAKAGVALYAYDQRGFGRAPGRGRWAGETLLKQDLKAAVTAARQRHPSAKIAVLGHSMGGAVAITAFADPDPPAAERLILAAPAVWGWTSQPVLNRVALWLGAHAAPGAVLDPPTWLAERHLASDNLVKLRQMGRDPQMIFRTRIDVVQGLVDLMEHASQRMALVRAPVFYLYGAHDNFVPKAATARAVLGLKPTDRSAYYPDGWHLLLRDLHRAEVRRDMIAYLRAPEAPLPSRASSLRDALKDAHP